MDLMTNTVMGEDMDASDDRKENVAKLTPEQQNQFRETMNNLIKDAENAYNEYKTTLEKENADQATLEKENADQATLEEEKVYKDTLEERNAILANFNKAVDNNRQAE